MNIKNKVPQRKSHATMSIEELKAKAEKPYKPKEINQTLKDLLK